MFPKKLNLRFTPIGKPNNGYLSMNPSNDEEKLWVLEVLRCGRREGEHWGLGATLGQVCRCLLILGGREGGASLPAAKVSIATVPDPNAGPFLFEYASQFQKKSFALFEDVLQTWPKEWPQKYCNGIIAQCRLPAPLRASHTPHSALAGCNSTLQIIKGHSSLTDAT